MTTDLLRRVGAALCEQHWQAELAHTLSVNRRIVQRREAGGSPIPPTLPTIASNQTFTTNQTCFNGIAPLLP
jgi:hypothetical protein